MSARKQSYLTVTDQFCGAGGSSIGASAAGLEIRMAMNHWKLAVETHNTNFPDADHDCADISASDPRRYPSTDILITSPECTTHSPAGGNRHRRPQQRDLFVPAELDPATIRSRATMWDVVRFTEYHQYRAVIVENVVEVVRTWLLFNTWWQAMENLGYVGEIVSLNSMFAHPTPQSRDRIYIVWTRKGNHRPDLVISPVAPCAKCGDAEARQSWKTGRRVGKYGARNQYIYTCPTCHAAVTPYYFCALNALDFSIPAERIGDRKKPLKARTLGRVRFGLDTYGNRPLQVTVNQVSGVSCRVRGLDSPLFGQTGSNTVAVVAPWMLSAGSNEFGTRSTAESPTPAMTGSDRAAVAFTPFIAVNRTNANGTPLDSPLSAMCTGKNHAVIQPAALVRLIYDRPVYPLDEPLSTQTSGEAQNLLVSPSPFLVQYYGSSTASPVDDSIPSVTTLDRHAVVSPRTLEVDDCYFRMLTPPEIGQAMAFPGSYTVLGTNRDKVKQYGNAVTPPAMSILIERVVQSITGERAA